MCVMYMCTDVGMYVYIYTSHMYTYIHHTHLFPLLKICVLCTHIYVYLYLWVFIVICICKYYTCFVMYFMHVYITPEH